MRNVLGIVIAICVVGLLVAPAPAKEMMVKVGGGALAGDETIFGPTVALNIPTELLEGRLNIQPFAEGYINKSWFKVAGGGVNAIIKHEAGEGLQVFGGAGGGVGHVRYRGESKTTGLVNAIAGLEYAASDKITVFVQGKYLYVVSGVDYRYRMLTSTVFRTTTIDVQDFAIQAGLAFNVGQ